MPTGRFQPIVRALLLVAGCVLFGAGVWIEHAQAQQFAPPPPPQLPPPQAPVFNPSSPYTVPQPSYRPLAPATPGAVSSGYVVPSPVNGRLPRRGQPLMLTDERPSQKRAQSTTEDATSLLARHRNLTLTMNRLSVMAIAALGGERGTGIGFEPSRVRSFS
jgi:hypothetical protein